MQRTAGFLFRSISDTLGPPPLNRIVRRERLVNKKFILSVAVPTAFAEWILFALLLFFDDHFPGNPPPGALELVITYSFMILAFPLAIYSRLVDGPSNEFFALVVFFLLTLAGGLCWGVAVERLRAFVSHVRRTRSLHSRPR